jgi:hypothetical protein
MSRHRHGRGLASLICRVAGHIGKWTYPDERCVRVRMCNRCGEITSKREHTWGAFGYVATGRCEQQSRRHWYADFLLTHSRAACDQSDRPPSIQSL